MQNSEVIIQGHGAFRDFKQKNTKKRAGEEMEKKKHVVVGGVERGVWFIIQCGHVYFSFSCKIFFHILPFSSIVWIEHFAFFYCSLGLYLHGICTVNFHGYCTAVLGWRGGGSGDIPKWAVSESCIQVRTLPSSGLACKLQAFLQLQSTKIVALMSTFMSLWLCRCEHISASTNPK